MTKKRNRQFNISATTGGAGEPNKVEDMNSTPTPDTAEENLQNDADTSTPDDTISNADTSQDIVLDENEEGLSEGVDPQVPVDGEPSVDEIVDDIEAMAANQESGPRDLNAIPVNNWTVEELVGYITGSLEGVPNYHSTVLKAIDEHRRREDTIDRAWSLQEVREYLAQGIVPPKTSKGAWLKDVTRNQRREGEWTTQELESWALGEIHAGGLNTAPGLAIELKRRLMIHTVGNTVAPQDVIQAYIHQTGQSTVTSTAIGEVPTVSTMRVADDSQAQLEAQQAAEVAAITYKGLSPMNVSYIESTLAQYLAVCKPGRITSLKSGLDAQKALDHLIRNYIIGLEDPQGIKSGLDIVLATIKKNRANGMAFDDTHAFRFTGDLPVAQNIQQSHVDLLTLFFIFADEDKEQRKQFDIPTLVSLLPAKKQPFLLQYFMQYA